MATKLYTNDIDKTIDWGGDAQTGGLPVSGEKVQKFIKDTLAKKFGFMYFDKDDESNFPTSDGGTIYVRKHTASKQYLIFADEDDFAVWAADPDNNKTVILGNFDAPAPATIEVENATTRSNTILLVDADSQTISFEYYIKQSSGGFGGGEMLLNISITNGNNINNLPRQSLGILNTDGTHGRFEFKNFGRYLSEGTNIIKFTLTSVEFNVSRSIDFQFNVVSFIISSDFDYTHGFALEDGYLPLSVTCQAQGQKYIRIFVDNESIFGYMDEEREKPNGKYIGGDTTVSFEADAFLIFDNFKSTWAKPGQHNVQFYCYIQNSDGSEIYSKTLYYDFVLTEIEMNNAFFILFNKEIEGGKIIPNDEDLVISTEQYNDIEVQFGVYNNKNVGNTDSGNILVDINLEKEGETEPFYTTQAEYGNGEINTFKYTIQEYGNVDLTLSITADGITTTSHVGVEIDKSSADVNKITDNVILDLSALNRSNAEPADQREVWEYRRPRLNQEDEVIHAIFDNVLWNDQCGWKDNALVLDNASVEIPMNIFNNYNIQNGLTFEIDFETANVQNDDAVIMEYGNPNASFISIKACSAEMKSEVGKSIKTNYKDGSRQKIQFIYAGQNEATNDLPHLYYLVVNGILDRVVKFDDSVSGGAQSFVIGNKNGEVTIKIYNIRIYNKALSLDQCISNYVADSGKNILDLFNKNNVYVEGQKNIDVNKVLANGVPVMTIFGDVTTSISKLFNKKTNVPVDVLYQDPTDPDGQFDFFAADCWMSNQGTSSMNYPRRNLRLYFNKEADGTTLRGYGDDENYKYNTRVYPGLTNMDVIHQLQSREIDDVFNVTVGDKVYHPLCNKKWKIEKDGTIKTLKDSADWKDLKNVMCEIKDEEKARRLWHSGIKLYTFKQKKDGNTGEPIDDYEYKKVKSFNSDLYKNDSFQGCYVYGGYTHFKAKDLYTDRWTIKCDYAESSMTHNAGVGRLWGSVLENVEISDGGYINRWNPETKEITRFSTKNACRTNAQIARDEYEASTGHQYGDIRTSCDGYPIVIINYPRKRDENNNIILGQWGDPIFLGLHNIMTDKGSTPLFGFEDLKDDNGKVIFDASKVECWECLQNGSSLAAMYDMKTDDKDGSKEAWNDDEDASIETDRLIWKTYEARWPDNDNWNLTKTNNLETLIRFVNFCKDAVNVTVAGRDAYNISDFSQIKFDETGDYTEQAVADDMTKLRELIRRKNESIIDTNLWNGKIYIEEPAKSYKEKTSNFYKKDSEGNYILNPDKTNQFLDPNDETDYAKLVSLVHGKMWYKITFGAGQAATTGANAMAPAYSEADDDSTRIAKIVAVFNSDTPSIYQQTLDYSDVSYEEVDTIVAGQGNKYFYYDSGYDRTDISKEINTTPMKDEVYSGLVYTFDGKRKTADGDLANPDAYVRAYLEKSGTNSFTYVNEMGEKATFVGGTNGEGFEQETCSGNVGTRGTSFKGKTKIEYFSDKKYEHFDVWKLAAYYIYIMRFAAVDQVIKNTMMTTEDGQHYYFINYDNDTVLGVRNDGHLVFDWQIDRNSYDSTGNSYAYAGFSSVLWNCLEADQDFMNKVQIVANAMVNSGALTYDIALDMFNVKQAGTWSERLYNNSEMYKYIGTFNDMDNKGKSNYNPYQNTNYLPFLQGSRKSHREWWLRHRFDYYDSKWSAGEYANSFMKVYFNDLSASPGNPKPIIGLTSASKFYYTIITNTRQMIGRMTDAEGNIITNGTFTEIKANETAIVNTQESLAIGDPIKVLGAHKAKEINLSYSKGQMTSELAFDNSGGAWNSNSLKVLNIGGDNDNRCGIQAIQGMDKLTSLEVLNIRGCLGLATPDISKLLNLKVYDARTTMITSFEPAVGVHMTEAHLPSSSIRSIKLVDAKFDEEAFDYEPSKILSNVVISNVEGIDIIDFLVKWNDEIDSDNSTKAIKNTYKCTLSFDKIKLPSVIQHKNGEEENSIVWLNRIKKEFGTDINGKPNFNIAKGVMEIQGKLEEEQYNLLANEKYQGTSINVWDEGFFKSVSPAHFDATETSIFIRVKVNGEVIDKENFKAIHVVAGAQIDFASIVFPISNERTIIYRPYHLVNNKATLWSRSTSQQNAYIGAFGVNNNQLSSFTFEPSSGTAKMSLFEYTEFGPNYRTLDAITMPIGIYEKVNADAEEVQLNRNDKLEIVMAKAVKPQNVDFEVYKNDSTQALPPKGDEVDNATMPIEYRLEASEGIVTNIKMKQVAVSISDIGCGDVKAELKEYDEESGKAGKQYILVTYSPKISNVDKLFNIDTVVTLDDKTSSQFTISFAVKLITKNITDIELSAIDGASYEIVKDGDKYKFEEYIKLTNESTKSYKFNVSLGDYNVAIKNMTATILDGLTDISLITTKVDNIITQIELFVPSLANSFDEELTVQISVVDEFSNLDNPITKDIDVKIGLYYPDQVKIFKDENGSGDRESLNIDILMGDTSSIYAYKVHIYSLINNTRYYWALDGETSEQYLDTDNRLRENTSIVTSDKVVLNTFNSSNVTFNINLDDNQQLLTEPTSSNILVKKYGINTSGWIGTIEARIECSVNIPNHTCTLIDTSTFEVARNGASGKDGVWQNLESGIYIMDSKKRFFMPNNYPVDPNIKDVAIIYVYDDGNDVKKNIAIDHRLLLSKKDGKERLFYQWPSTSTFMNSYNITDNYGFWDETTWNKATFDPLWNHLNPTTNDLGEKFEQMAKYYAFICAVAGGNNYENDKVLIRVNGRNQYINMTDYGNNYKLVAEKINDGEITLDYTFEDENMIFYYVNRYNQEYALNYVCRPLCYEEIKKVIDDFSTNSNLKDTFNYICKNIFELTGIGKDFDEAFNAIIDKDVHYNGNDDIDTDGAGMIVTDITKVNRKLFWVLNTIEPINVSSNIADYTHHDLPEAQSKELSKYNVTKSLFYRAHYANNKWVDNTDALTQSTASVTGKTYLSPNSLYCIFGPHLP